LCLHFPADLPSSPDFDSPSERFGYPFGLIVYYSWNFLTTIILVNVLIALFGSAYSDVEENATDEYLAFFAHKTIDMSEWTEAVGATLMDMQSVHQILSSSELRRRRLKAGGVLIGLARRHST
jgi:hypothetical protein